MSCLHFWFVWTIEHHFVAHWVACTHLWCSSRWFGSCQGQVHIILLAIPSSTSKPPNPLHLVRWHPQYLTVWSADLPTLTYPPKWSQPHCFWCSQLGLLGRFRIGQHLKVGPQIYRDAAHQSVYLSICSWARRQSLCSLLSPLWSCFPCLQSR